MEMKHSGNCRLLTIILFLCLYHSPALAQKAFPGAEGFGARATGGRGGRVVEVTNTNGDVSPGSFRAALATPGTDPITIVFRVSGCISFDTSIVKCKRQNMTIAGQTAPGDGICIRKGKIYFSGSNMIIRFIRFRVGDEFRASVAALDIENCTNLIVDHCSISWSVEENMDNYDTKYSTVQWCIISEGLYNSVNIKGARAYGSQWGGQYASYHHNLFAHNVSRSPRVNGCRSHDTAAVCDYRNNVIYNWGKTGAIYGGEVQLSDAANPGKARCNVNWINNYYQPGPATSKTTVFAQPSYNDGSGTATGYAKWYFSGNFMSGVSGGMNTDNWEGVDVSKVTQASNIKSDTPFEVDAVTTQSAKDAYTAVLEGAGATKPKRDAVDVRIVGQIKGTVTKFASDSYGENKGIIDSAGSVGGWPQYNSTPAPTDSDHDGMPDSWEVAHGLSPTDSTDGNKLDASGYTMLEVYLDDLVNGATKLPQPNLSGKQESPARWRIATTAGSRSILVSLNKPSFVTLSVYNIRGQEVKRLIERYMEVGTSATSLPEGLVGQGVYFLRLATSNGHSVSEMFMKVSN